jgi:methionyl-tRNA formyltransferase
MSKKIIFFGNERLATGTSTNNPVLNSLIKNGYSIECIILSQNEIYSRKDKKTETEILAENNNIPCYMPKSKIETEEIVKKYNSDIAILVAYGKLIPQSIIDLFSFGIINLHPSLLPTNRGTTPIETAILDGVSETGVSIMKLDQGMDSGPIYVQKRLKIAQNESKQSLADRLGLLGSDLIIQILPKILNHTLVPENQTKENLSISKSIKKLDGIIDWSLDANIIERQIRAYLNWPRSSTMIFNKKVIITQASVVSIKSDVPGKVIESKNKLIISCGKDALSINQLIPENKKQMSVSDFLNGYKK